ncbi:NirD/YgiW/YdeI family stress tolerance protein [Fluviispira multicolorata]|uniref:NirD/YgiW/YdeI family stress tolerance protein n=1 Tax=Fluviispira multicolorata TaxID=2654512 RepID=A0A833JFQ8_9BACT|nr:NirD/YgiW/YdeI family stress tolerance protein [Fluviispira multicolorata]KAB8031741.1 NirD/YgiW/YdeI family stress tolerance protein [Fluviispira multicolorata]
MSVIKFTIILSTLVVSFVANADFVSSKKTDGEITIKAALELKDKDSVVIVGKIIKEIRSEKYLIVDNNGGEICVEIHKKDMPTEKFDENVDLRISGEIDKDFKPNGDQCDKFKIEAKKVEIVKNK